MIVDNQSKATDLNEIDVSQLAYQGPSPDEVAQLPPFAAFIREFSADLARRLGGCNRKRFKRGTSHKTSETEPRAT